MFFCRNSMAVAAEPNTSVSLPRKLDGKAFGRRSRLVHLTVVVVLVRTGRALAAAGRRISRTVRACVSKRGVCSQRPPRLSPKHTMRKPYTSEYAARMSALRNRATERKPRRREGKTAM